MQSFASSSLNRWNFSVLSTKLIWCTTCEFHAATSTVMQTANEQPTRPHPTLLCGNFFSGKQLAWLEKIGWCRKMAFIGGFLKRSLCSSRICSLLTEAKCRHSLLPSIWCFVHRNWTFLCCNPHFAHKPYPKVFALCTQDKLKHESICATMTQFVKNFIDQFSSCIVLPVTKECLTGTARTVLEDTARSVVFVNEWGVSTRMAQGRRTHPWSPRLGSCNRRSRPLGRLVPPARVLKRRTNQHVHVRWLRSKTWPMSGSPKMENVLMQILLVVPSHVQSFDEQTGTQKWKDCGASVWVLSNARHPEPGDTGWGPHRRSGRSSHRLIALCLIISTPTWNGETHIKPPSGLLTTDTRINFVHAIVLSFPSTGMPADSELWFLNCRLVLKIDPHVLFGKHGAKMLVEGHAHASGVRVGSGSSLVRAMGHRGPRQLGCMMNLFSWALVLFAKQRMWNEQSLHFKKSLKRTYRFHDDTVTMVLDSILPASQDLVGTQAVSKRNTEKSIRTNNVACPAQLHVFSL